MSWATYLLHGPLSEFPLRAGAPAVRAGERNPGVQPVSAPKRQSPGDQAPSRTPGVGR